MLFKNMENLNGHDYFNVIVKIYPKLKIYINNILNSFELSKDASSYFVDYFSEGHNEIHKILGENYPCSDINILLNDLLFSVIKFDRNNDNYEVPNLFYNFHAVHYYNKIKNKIDHLHRLNMEKEQIIDFLVLWERERHENKECDCGESHKLLGKNQLRELFLQILEYYYSVKIINYENTLGNEFSYKQMKYLN